MKCKVCGAESGKYPLCFSCNKKRARGEIIKCPKCGQWHYSGAVCVPFIPNKDAYLYKPKTQFITKTEQDFFLAIRSSIPEGYFVFPQVNLATFIDRTDDMHYRNELFRNIDFLITSSEFSPVIAIEINDQSHLTNDRRKRDEKVRMILEEAGIPLLKFWTSYGINPNYIKSRVSETLTSPQKRIHHFSQEQTITTDPASQVPPPASEAAQLSKKQGCYIATCVYGSYDCPQVWVLRRYRDTYLSASVFGQILIRLYYIISPTAVRLLGNIMPIRKFWKSILDRKIFRLKQTGFSDQPYQDIL